MRRAALSAFPRLPRGSSCTTDSLIVSVADRDADNLDNGREGLHRTASGQALRRAGRRRGRDRTRSVAAGDASHRSFSTGSTGRSSPRTSLSWRAPSDRRIPSFISRVAPRSDSRCRIRWRISPAPSRRPRVSWNGPGFTPRRRKSWRFRVPRSMVGSFAAHPGERADVSILRTAITNR